MPLEVFLARVIRRLRLRDLLRGTSVGTTAAAVILVILRAVSAPASTFAPATIATFAMATAVMSFASRDRHTPEVAARTVEHIDGSLRNLLITAQQLMAAPALTRPYMRDRVLDDAARRMTSVDLARSLPVWRDAIIVAAATVLLVVAAAIPFPATAGTTSGLARSARSLAELGVRGFSLEITPPAYTNRAVSLLQDPSVLEVLSGSQATLRLRNAAGARVRLGDVTVPIAGGVARFVFVDSGYIAIEGGGLDRLIPVTVVPDRAPVVRIAAPGKDLRVATTAAAIPIVVEATDDLGLQSLDLRYTVVSGMGEQFAFTEGALPAKVSHTSKTAWRLEASLSLATLKLEAGDALIYRAVGSDRRPGDAGIGASETFFVEVAGPGDVPLEGVEMPPDKERYALSEAMIVLKIERLQARERGLSRDALLEAAGTIAAEQRAVRANFIFMLGGEVEDEQVEAESSNEISEGRFANQARHEIVAATVRMGRVEKALGVPATPEALTQAREAVRTLQRAFGHSRYLLRALPSRARLDPARRLSGDVSSALDWTRAAAAVASDPQVETARLALADLAAASVALGDAARRPAIGALLGRLAERLLAPGSAADWQTSAREVIAARNALTADHADQAAAALRRAAPALLQYAQRDRIDGSAVGRAAARLAGAAVVAQPGGRQ